MLINGTVTLTFVLDSGASDVSIPADVFGTLIRAGTITPKDILGAETYLLADGSTKKSPIFRIRSLTIGSTVVANVRASVAADAAPLLLGMSFLAHSRSWSVDNSPHVLVQQ
jgi:clan AA aspartic protease (TIGR02281 family)